jgi:hypothetical protein
MKPTKRNGKLRFSLLLESRLGELMWNNPPGKLIVDGNLPVTSLW